MIPGGKIAVSREQPYLTSGEIYELRKTAGWVSPVKPLEPGDLWWVFISRGTWEFICHPKTANELSISGIVIDGERMYPQQVDEHPLLNGVQLRVQSLGPVGFVDSANVR